MQLVQHTEFQTRALSAYIRQTKRDGIAFEQPRSVDTWVDEGAKMYVVLHGGSSADRIIAVYRVRNDDILKRLKRWPSAITEKYA
ncbi:MAG: hypothetical protein CVU28_03395 [Betaproteobacteria bacterium HGW-Betaproteobacteria-21]|nr:MAG: hypothetical protein CVU28_03395 [Betaproteobacteria bacterium HGW-Betaproteobacteria-21]